MIPAQRRVPLGQIRQPAWGWKYDDRDLAEKLATSIRGHGQLTVLVVRTVGRDEYEVVDGRRRLEALRAAGATHAWVVDVGGMDADAATVLALALELRFETDYARLVAALASLSAARGGDLSGVASTAPFTAAQLGHYVALAAFDWSVFAVDDGQHGLDFGEGPADGPDPGGPVGDALAAQAALPDVPVATRPPTAPEPPTGRPEPDTRPPGRPPSMFDLFG